MELPLFPRLVMDAVLREARFAFEGRDGDDENAVRALEVDHRVGKGQAEVSATRWQDGAKLAGRGADFVDQFLHVVKEA